MFSDIKVKRHGRQMSDPFQLQVKVRTVSDSFYTGDANLIADFEDKKLIDRPRGKVYSTAANAGLLTKAACAPRG